jgi:hypothetical protein
MLTDDEKAFIQVIELAKDFNLPIKRSDLERYEELIKRSDEE